MWMTIVLCLACAGAVQSTKFPPYFKFGAATAAYQVEGSWNASDKSTSIWDHYVHTKPEGIKDLSSGDVACDSYNQWQRDVEIAVELGLHFYRFSISWPRLLPTGYPNYISEDGRQYYDNLINALLEKGIEPVVTLYHWDLPQSFQYFGGWTNALVSDWFADYARVVFSLYADRVKIWITLNEPLSYCDVAYHFGVHAPGIVSPWIGSYLCSKNAMLAHAKAWRIYDEEFRPKYKGKVSITNHLIWVEARGPEDEEDALLARQFMAMYIHPIYSQEGGWPPLVEDYVTNKCKKEGLRRSRLPPFTNEEKEFVKGTFDFLGFNYYTSRVAYKAKTGQAIGSWPLLGNSEIGIAFGTRPEWRQGGTSWFFQNPVGIRNLLRWFKKHYGDIEILITENGYGGCEFGVDDYDRVKYYKDHLEQVLLAIYEDKINVTYYTAWAMIDNFEWSKGYTSKFGLYQVDFEDPKRTRRPRASAEYYKRVIQQHTYKIDDYRCYQNQSAMASCLAGNVNLK